LRQADDQLIASKSVSGGTIEPSGERTRMETAFLQAALQSTNLELGRARRRSRETGATRGGWWGSLGEGGKGSRAEKQKYGEPTRPSRSRWSTGDSRIFILSRFPAAGVHRQCSPPIHPRNLRKQTGVKISDAIKFRGDATPHP
jgi:hypothetical protein